MSSPAPSDAEREWLTPEDYALLSRMDHGKKAATEAFEYALKGLFRRYRIGPHDCIELDGSITRGGVNG